MFNSFRAKQKIQKTVKNKRNWKLNEIEDIEIFDKLQGINDQKDKVIRELEEKLEEVDKQRVLLL